MADTTPPILTSLTLPTTINLANGPAAGAFSVGATDVGSGVGDVLIQFDHAFTTVAGSLNTLVFLNGASTLSQTFSAGSTSGVYNVTLLSVLDNAGNLAVYTAAQLQAMHLPTSFTLAGGTGTGASGFVTPGSPNTETTGTGSTGTGTTGSSSGLSSTPNITGTTGADILAVHSGDLVYGGAGNDIITGGSGVTTSLYSGTMAGYGVSQSGTAVTIADTTPSRDGTDTLNNVSQAKFSDYTLVFDLQSAQDLLVYKVYQAAYGRIPDNAGYRYWSGIADANHTSATSLADSFLAAPEFTQLYGASPSNTTYVTSLYSHVLGRTPDQAGFDYWLGQANAGQPKDALLVSFATSPENATLIGSHVALGYWTT